jgi:hypothetical protein
MIAPKRQQNAYDHRLRESVFRSGRKETAKRIGVPGSTIHGWTKARPRPVVTLIAEGLIVRRELENRVRTDAQYHRNAPTDRPFTPK